MKTAPIKATIYHNEDDSKNLTTGVFLKNNAPNWAAYKKSVIDTYKGGSNRNTIRVILFYDRKTDAEIGRYTPQDGFQTFKKA